MQKKIIALAVAALASSAAFAQSNVTVYGIVDVGGLYQDGQVGKNQFSVNSGVLSTSRLGFKGVEDLGNGLKAVFTLEYGLNVDANAGIGGTVTSTSTNARQQFVGLTGGFGTVIAGRLQTTGYDFTVAGSALGGSTGIGATSVVGGPGANGGTTLLSAFSRANNAVAYVSPSFGGVTFAYNHARMTEAALNTNTADGYANLLSASYAAGPITAGLAYGKLSAANTPLSDDHKEWGIRGGYDFGVAKLQATYQQQKNDATSAVGKDKKYVVSLSAPIGAKVAVIGEYAKLAKDSTSIADDSKAFT
ncbi:MAG: porin, partial [Azonexus sp.]|nr:porin [Azonexus sp.]